MVRSSSVCAPEPEKMSKNKVEPIADERGVHTNCRMVDTTHRDREVDTV